VSDEENKLSTCKSEILDILNSSLGLVRRFIDERSITDSALNTSRKLYSSLEKNNANNAKDAVLDAASKIDKQNIKKEIYELAQKVVEDSEKEKTEKSNIINDKKSSGKTGTVWDYIIVTQKNYPNTNIPGSFEIKVNG